MSNTDLQPDRSVQHEEAPIVLFDAGRSEKLDKFLPAYRTAQAAIESAEKTRTNDHFGNSYPTLSSVMKACKKPLNDNSLSIIQRNIPASSPGLVAVETFIMHDSEQYISCSAECEAGRPGPQAFGSATTYLRRYTLSTLAGVCPDDGDDDGEGSDEQRETPTDVPPVGRRESKPRNTKPQPTNKAAEL